MTPVVARLQKTLSKEHSNGRGSIRRVDGSFTVEPSDTLSEMLRIHFPDSIPQSRISDEGTEIVVSVHQKTISLVSGTKRDAIKVAKEAFTCARVERAVRSFEPFKSAGMDGIFPALIQKAEKTLIPHMVEIFRASLILGHIPDDWRQVRVVFIPKTGKKDKTNPKAFRPISLSSVMLKIMEKVLCEYINSKFMKAMPLSQHQFAYQSGKSTISALHSLVNKIEKTLQAKEIALVAFLDIEGAFDNASYSSIGSAMLRRHFDPCIATWVHAMLANRQISSELSGSCVTVKATRGCPQGGVLSPLLWSLVVDELLDNLERRGFEVVGYADDVVIIVRGKFEDVIFERMQLALDHTFSWCQREQLGINPSKTTIVPFTKRRKVQLRTLLRNETQLTCSKEAKYLGVILDSKLNWHSHLQTVVQKGLNSLWVCSRALGKKWGLKPSMIMWIYKTIVRPRITYASLIWWPKTKEATARAKLNKIQRIACIAITGAARSTPTSALDAMLNLPRLDKFIKLDAEKSALRLKRTKTLLSGDLTGHLSILNEFSINPIVEKCSDRMEMVVNYDIPYQVIMSSRQEWEEGGPNIPPGSIKFYTDGSKMNNLAGSGVYGSRTKTSIHLGQWSTVFQAEIYAILECALLCLKRKYRHASICILSDSQAALQALNTYTCNSKLVWECILALKKLALCNRVNLYWIPGHAGLEGNEIADELARNGSANRFTGPEPFFGISDSFLKMELNNWLVSQTSSNWDASPCTSQSKRLVNINPKKTQQLLGLSKRDLSLYTGLVTGHCPSRYHLQKIGVVQNSNCRFCDDERETSEHLICYCSAQIHCRSRIFGKSFLEPADIRIATPSNVIGFIKLIAPDWGNPHTAA